MNNLALLETLTGVVCVSDKSPERYAQYNEKIKDFETKLSQWYPLGDKEFKINHGNNYFLFFQRMGSIYYYAMMKNSTVQGTMCVILRTIDNVQTFYVCDLKLDHSIRGKNLIMKFLIRSIPECITIAQKFYAISMNNENEENKIFQMLQHVGNKLNVNIQTGGELYLYSLDYNQMKKLHELVVSYKSYKLKINKECIKYVSLRGIKDLIIKDQEEPLKLLHLCYLKNDIGEYYNEPLKNATHMFCVPASSWLAKNLEKINIIPSAKATIIHYKMNNFNWNFIQTCDI